MLNTADLPDDIDALKAMLVASEARNLRKDERIARLEKLVAAFRQAVFGRKSEKSDPDQFELALEDLETAIAEVHAEEEADTPVARRAARPRAVNRGALPRHLPRIEEVIEPESLTCACGGCLHCIGEDGEPLMRHWFEHNGERTARHRPCPVPGDRDAPPQIRVPQLHRRRCAG